MKYSENYKKYFFSVLYIILFIASVVFIYTASVFIYSKLSVSVAMGILEYLKVITWPAVVVLLVILFRKDISNFLARLVKGKNSLIGEWEASPAATQEQANINSEDAQAANAILEEQEIKKDEGNDKKMDDALTKAQVELDFERIFNFIFSNQINLLNEIKSLGGKIALSYAADHFEKVKEKFPFMSDWNVVKYLEYLINTGLIEYETASGFISVGITPKGETFIAYLAARNYKKDGL